MLKPFEDQGLPGAGLLCENHPVRRGFDLADSGTRDFKPGRKLAAHLLFAVRRRGEKKLEIFAAVQREPDRVSPQKSGGPVARV